MKVSISLGLQSSHLSNERLEQVIPQTASSPDLFRGLVLTGDRGKISHSFPTSYSPSCLHLAYLTSPQLYFCPQKALDCAVGVVNVGSRSFLVTGQHCSATCRGPTNLVCLCRASAYTWKMPRSCSSRSGALLLVLLLQASMEVRGWCLESSQCQDLTTESNLLVCGPWMQLGLGIRWDWG
jgi:hypothetical protein